MIISNILNDFSDSFRYKNDPLIIQSHSTKIIEVKNNSIINVESYFKNLQNFFGVSYLFYMYEDLLNDSKIIYTSNDNWQKYLVKEKLINHCPIMKTGVMALSSIRKKEIILPWCTITSNTSLEKEVVALRRDFDIANGVGYGWSDGSIRESIGIAGSIKDLKFYQRALKENLLKNTLSFLRFQLLYNGKTKFNPS